MEKSKARSAVIEVAQKEFMTNGIKAVKMDNIASSLNMSKRTIYELFETKELLLEECIVKFQKEKEKKMASITKAAKGDLLKVLVGAFKYQVEIIPKVNAVFYDELSYYPNLVTRLENNNNEHDSQLLAFFHEGVKQGIFRDTINYNLIIESFRNQLKSIVTNKLYNKYPLMDMFNSLTMVLFRGLVTEKALQQFEKLYNT